jgi:phosphoribosylformimino-5-aminoimidazole carboxamide ribotide isomerase
VTSPLPHQRPGFVVLPAIDLRDGRVVRLAQGDFGRETAYGDDPVPVARAFARAGATWLHVVDLDGAMRGEPVQLDAAARIALAAGSGVRCEFAGGLRTPAAVERALQAGAARVAVGTAALRDPAFAAELISRHGAGAVAIALDVRDGLALGEGWRPGASGVRAEAALLRLAAEGARLFEVTAIERDGLLGGPDLDLLARLVALDAGDVIASGGVADLDDLRRVRDLGCAGAIVGRAIYEGRLDLAAAIAEVSGAA